MKINQAYQKLCQKAQTYRQEMDKQPWLLVGSATCGQAAGALQIKACLEAEIAAAGQSWPVWEGGCLGHCYAEPLVLVHNPGFPDLIYGFVNVGLARRLIRDYLLEGDPCLEYLLAAAEENELGLPTLADFPRGQLEKRILLARCGRIAPEDIQQALARGAYAALSQALEQNPEDLLQIVAESGLRGRGGAGFPAARKWQFCRQAKGSARYLICNADEGDPGAFMDRSLLESDPHLLLEGMLLAAYILEAQTGFIYVRAEYPLAIARLQTAIRQAQECGLLGNNILGSSFNFNLQIFQGAGAFVCGEESALLSSMQGFAGIPYPRPPHPTEAGYLGQPTVINNVKTLCFLPSIINGTKPDTLLLALAGQIPNPGLLEVPLGTSLQDLIQIGGSGQDFKAIQLGGPSGCCLPQNKLNLPLDYDTLQKAGAILGSGGIIVLNQQDCMVETARYFLEFTQQESCGKCSFCRLGTQQMLHILNRIVQGEGQKEDLELLQKLAAGIQAGSLCNLGKTAPNPVLSTLKYFRSEYLAHIEKKQCPALACSALIEYYILPERCERSCDICSGKCPVEAIVNNAQQIKIIDQDKCVKCDSCLPACPPQYQAIIKRPKY